MLDVQGTVALAGFSRKLVVPLLVEVATNPRTPGAAVQAFDTTMKQLSGSLPPNSDSALWNLQFTAGDSLIPGSRAGHTILTQHANGEFLVDSLFDVEYDLSFNGCPSSALDGLFGTTRGTVQMTAVAGPAVPSSSGSGLVVLASVALATGIGGILFACRRAS